VSEEIYMSKPYLCKPGWPNRRATF